MQLATLQRQLMIASRNQFTAQQLMSSENLEKGSSYVQNAEPRITGGRQGLPHSPGLPGMALLGKKAWGGSQFCLFRSWETH